MNLTTIQLTEDEAKLFVQFQKHFAMIGLLDSVGTFDLQNASIKINFDSYGKIGSIEKHQFYRQ